MARRAPKPVTRVPAFWDSSALVALCVHQSSTSSAVECYSRYEVVIWWATPVEIASALARLLRMRQLDVREWTKAHELANLLAGVCSVIQPSDALRASAAQLVNRYDLRAADSLQLAAAQQWCEDISLGRVFLTADHKLREAAMLKGFDVQQMCSAAR